VTAQRRKPRLDRRTLLAGLLCMAGGCTLRPLYGPTATAPDAPPRRVALTAISGREGFLFREALRRRFELDDSAPDRLEVDLDIRQRGIAITTLGDTTRFNIDGTARFVFTRTGDQPPLTGTVRSISGYDTLESPYATRVARDAAEERVIGDLAERLFARIALQGAEGA
jgi:LPS-assembly lipoprotein